MVRVVREGAERFLPQDCGSSILKDNKDGEKIVLSVGALEAPTGLALLKNIFEGGKGELLHPARLLARPSTSIES